MDPDANLRDQLDIARKIHQLIDDTDPSDAAAIIAHAEELADRVIALDSWIRRGGFLPRAYQPKGAA